MFQTKNFGFELKVHGSKHLLFSFYLSPTCRLFLVVCSVVLGVLRQKASKQATKLVFRSHDAQDGR
jgi:hypothetical protein